MSKVLSKIPNPGTRVRSRSCEARVLHSEFDRLQQWTDQSAAFLRHVCGVFQYAPPIAMSRNAFWWHSHKSSEVAFDNVSYPLLVGHSARSSRATCTWATISRGGQVAHQPLRAGVAEGAVQRAADLAGDAERARAGDVGDEDGLDLDAGAKRISHFRVPSALSCRSAISGRASVKRSAIAARVSLAMSVIAAKSVTP